MNNVAYIDGANLHRGITSLGWELDYGRFRIWLRDKYKVERAFIFLGFLEHKNHLYDQLRNQGFELIFKQITYDGSGKVKGNCDAELILHAVVDVFEGLSRDVIVVSSDGDFSVLVKFLMEKGKLRAILSPHPQERCSILLKRSNAAIVYFSDLRPHLEVHQERAPGPDGTDQGSLSSVTLTVANFSRDIKILCP